MSAIFGEKLTLGQEKGPDVELVVFGDEFYARYETPAGFPAIYDSPRGLFCYARVVDGAYESSGISVANDPPPGIVQHAKESDAVRQAKAAAKAAARQPR
jgi:hypothetical protein